MINSKISTFKLFALILTILALVACGKSGGGSNSSGGSSDEKQGATISSSNGLPEARITVTNNAGTALNDCTLYLNVANDLTNLATAIWYTSVLHDENKSNDENRNANKLTNGLSLIAIDEADSVGIKLLNKFASFNAFRIGEMCTDNNYKVYGGMISLNENKNGTHTITINGKYKDNSIELPDNYDTSKIVLSNKKFTINNPNKVKLYGCSFNLNEDSNGYSHDIEFPISTRDKDFTSGYSAYFTQDDSDVIDAMGITIDQINHNGHGYIQLSCFTNKENTQEFHSDIENNAGSIDNLIITI